MTDTGGLGELSEIVTDLAEVVARLTHDEDYLAVPEGRAEAERLARQARRLARPPVGVAGPAKALTTRDPVRVPPTATLRSVARLLEREAIGAVLVEGTSGSVGIITERDVVRAVAAGVVADTEMALHWMRQPLVSVNPQETVVDAARAMAANRVRHLVLMDNDEVVGVVSARDVVPVLVDELVHAPA